MVRVRCLCVGLLLGLWMAGCARFPPTPDQAGGRRLVIEMQVAGRIRREYTYFVLFNLSNDPIGQQGPVPVVRPPWGNGFAAGAFTHFMRYDATQPQGGYGLYRVVPNTNLSVFNYIGAPRLSEPPIGANANRLRFEIDLTQLIPDPNEARAMVYVQVNFLATDRVPLDPNDPTPKVWDALGDSRVEINRYLNIRIDQNRILRNADSGIEVGGDMADADLDIVDWRIEVRTL
jgi:hypothetical protein